MNDDRVQQIAALETRIATVEQHDVQIVDALETVMIAVERTATRIPAVETARAKVDALKRGISPA
jgi:hypothetical protein